jgi:hypothetical protein
MISGQWSVISGQGAFHFRGEFFGDWKSLQQTRQVRLRGLRAQPTEVGFAGLLARF